MTKALATGAALGLLVVVLQSAASYPSSVKTFTTKANGDAIQAAHINDLQDEVTAIEGGLLNGLAHALKPVSDATYDLGTTLLQWRHLYLSGTATIPNTGLHLLDTDASHDLIVAPGSNLTADRTLTITTGDADRTLTLSGDVTLSGTPYAAGGTDVALADGGTGASLADPGADRVMFWDDSAGAVDWLTVGTGLSVSGTTLSATSTGAYALQFACGSMSGADWSPADASTYYCGSTPTQGPQTTGGRAPVVVPASGTITAASVTVRVAGTLGTTETFTVSVRLNNSTDTILSSSAQANATVQTFSNLALSIAVTAGAELELKVVFPTWATNPTTLHMAGVVFIE